jgi:prephenate dehydrogenase
MDINPDAEEKALLLNAIDRTLSDEEYGELDILIYAVTPRIFAGANDTNGASGGNGTKGADGVRAAAGRLKDGAVILDVAGTKAVITAEMKKLTKEYPTLEFVAAHPMAGREFSGVNYSSPSLFERASILLVPVKAELDTLAALKKFFVGIGFDCVRFTTSEEHDRIIAYTSQLPHVLSSCYIGSPTAEFHYGFSAGSFRDLSRVARMNAEMWTELFTENKENLLFELDGMLARLKEMRDRIARSDTDGLKELLSSNSAKKEALDKAGRAWKKKNKE